jgi:hypothetical protein
VKCNGTKIKINRENSPGKEREEKSENSMNKLLRNVMTGGKCGIGRPTAGINAVV